MNKEFLENRIQDLTKAISEVASHHTVLVGRLAEAKDLLSSIYKQEIESEKALKEAIITDGVEKAEEIAVDAIEKKNQR